MGDTQIETGGGSSPRHYRPISAKVSAVSRRTLSYTIVLPGGKSSSSGRMWAGSRKLQNRPCSHKENVEALPIKFRPKSGLMNPISGPEALLRQVRRKTTLITYKTELDSPPDCIV